MSVRAAQVTIGSIVLLAAWLGAALLLAAVITPAAFSVLPTRALAGALVGRALPVLFTAGAGVAVAVLAVHRFVEPGRLVGGAGAVFFLAVGAANVVAFRVSATLAAIGVPIDSLDPADPRRIAFGRMHGLSVVLMGISMLGASAALFGLSRYQLRRITI